ncbi:MAG: Transcriptional regulatory protein ZraR [Rhodocyclaceae bacterium]|nr:MAG: sigma-54-dependent Fis family transcriptional regulator [Rhodocyclaceae bacterium]MBV6409115.1 Transcriptional regulatory protein ZraR [Rhodocyclaceae bacterium]CAG0931457.1 Transcriptional regulatory protein ZraR [Rhodocyclaceae bacterium]
MTSPELRKPSLLIVDDDPLIIDTLAFFLGREFEIATAGSRADCIALLRSRNAAQQLALVDLGLPPLPHQPDEGFALISDLLAHSPSIKIIVLSGQNDEANARHARALGATEFVAKPADPELLRQTLHRILAYQSAELAAVPEAAEDPCGLLGNSISMQKLRAQIKQYGDSPFPVLIEGESGSGKEIVASCCLHRLTSRRDKPYFALNCAAISPNLVEPTLFGYAKGAFTGAVQAKSGYFEDAEDGTLFLDEIGELPIELQPKLLRVLENGEFQRVGETQQRVSRARVIAATNRDLRKEVREGRFRADLYHRLSVFTINVPPLREMDDDKVLLLRHYRAIYAGQARQLPFDLTDEALARWQAYGFPGNVRELRNIVIRLATKYPGRAVGLAALEDELDTGAETLQAPWLPPQGVDELSAIALRQLQQRGQFDLDDTLRRWEQGYIQAALKLTHGNVSQAARLLGVNRTTLYNRMEALTRDLGAAN